MSQKNATHFKNSSLVKLNYGVELTEQFSFSLTHISFVSSIPLKIKHIHTIMKGKLTRYKK